MKAAVNGLDHAAALVADIESAASLYRKLGFNLAPLGRHPEYGSVNHTIMFGNEYFEIIAVEDPRPNNLLMRERVTQYEGLWLLAMASSDLADTVSTLNDRAVVHGGADYYSRETVDEANHPATARFANLHLAYDGYPGAMVTICQHFTREFVWRKGLTDHPNGAQAIAEITLVAADPGRAAQCYAAVMGLPSRQGEDDFVFDFEAQRLRITNAKNFEARIGAAMDETFHSTALTHLALTVGDPGTTRAVLEHNGTAFRSIGSGAILVEPSLAGGVYIEFRDAR